MSAEQLEPGIVSRLLATPQTRLGRWSTGLAIAFLVLFAAWLLYVAGRPISRPTFFSDPIHAVLILTAAGAAVGGGILGLLAVATAKERSVLMGATVLLGAFVLYWAIAELISSH